MPKLSLKLIVFCVIALIALGIAFGLFPSEFKTIIIKLLSLFGK